MEKDRAISKLSDGHTIWKVGVAKEICVALGVPFDEKRLVRKWESTFSEKNYKGLQMREGLENTEGVCSLTLSECVARHFGVDKKAGSYIGRGFQAQAYAEAVAKKIGCVK